MSNQGSGAIDSAAIGLQIREELARRRLSRQGVADMAKISVSTLEKALAGRRPFTLATVIRLEEALGIPLRAGDRLPQIPPPLDGGTEADRLPAHAPDHLGGYARSSVRWLEGRYLTLRPSFGEEDGVFSYLTAISWDQGRGHLVFEESHRLDASYSQKGDLSFPALSGHIYLVTSVEGQFRMAVMGRPLGGGCLYGILTTLMAAAGTHLVPVATPLVMIPWAKAALDGPPEFGTITPEDRHFSTYQRELHKVTAQDFARFPHALAQIPT